MIHQKLNDYLKEAMKTNDEKLKNYTRGIKSKLAEYCVANKIDRSVLVSDEVATTVITTHKKSLEKAIELLSHNSIGQNLIDEYKGEIIFCEQFLPKAATEEEIKTVVDTTIKDLNIIDVKQVGKVVGIVIKHYKEIGQVVDGSIIKKLALEVLSKGA